MADSRSDSERTMEEGMKGGVINYDASEAVPEMLGGVKDYSGRVASKTGRSIPTKSAGGPLGGTGLLDTVAENVSDTTGITRSSEETASTEENTLPRDHHGGMNPLKAFTSRGAVGSQFNPEGPLGSIPQAVGGPFDKEGIVGKQFTSEGVIGGTVDKLLGEKNQKDPLGRQK